MLSLNGDRQNVTIFLTLSIILIAIGQSQGAEMINHSSSSPTSLISNQNSLRSNDESISNKLTQIRHLLKSLFFDWNSGERESEVKGSISRTFGRIRMMRKVIIPLTFIGGFLTAIIIGIKITGVFNVILVTKVLMLQLALVLGKMIYGLKDIFLSKQQPQQPVYVSTPEHHYYHQPSHIPSYGQSSYGPSQPYGPSSSYNPSSSYGTSSYGSQSPYASNREDGLAPHYNSPQLNPINPLHNFNQPQTDFIQPQVSPFGGITLQTPQKIQYSPHFNQPFTRLGYVESLDQRILRENMIDDQPAFKSSMSPQELTKVLSDAIAQVSSRTTPSPLLRALKKR